MPSFVYCMGLFTFHIGVINISQTLRLHHMTVSHLHFVWHMLLLILSVLRGQQLFNIKTLLLLGIAVPCKMTYFSYSCMVYAGSPWVIEDTAGHASR